MGSNSKRHCPSFVKVLIGDFANKLPLPPAFVAKCVRKFPPKAMIRAKRGESTWTVKLKEFGERIYFTGHGWEMFITDNDLKSGDFLYFSVISNWDFLITMYGANACEKGPPIGFPGKRARIAPRCSPSRMRQRSLAGQGKRPRGRLVVKAKREKNPPSFSLVLKRQNRYCTTIPKAFAVEAGIIGRELVKLRNTEGEVWPVTICSRPRNSWSTRIDLSSGWRNFQQDNKLKERDTCLFKFVPGSGNVIEVETYLP